MKNLKKLRTSQHLSQLKLAEHFNLTQQSIWKYENDLAQPDLDTLTKLAKFFNTSVDYLIGNTDNSRKYESLWETELNEDELYHLRLYRAASPELKGLMNQLLIVFNKEE